MYAHYTVVSNNSVLTLPISLSSSVNNAIVGIASACTSTQQPDVNFPTCIWKQTFSNFTVRTTTILGHYVMIACGY